MREGARLALAGVVIGGFGALAVGCVLAGLLLDVSARDPFVLATVAGVLVAVAVAASWFSARRALRVDAREV